VGSGGTPNIDYKQPAYLAYEDLQPLEKPESSLKISIKELEGNWSFKIRRHLFSIFQVMTGRGSLRL
jgi:hypothetical protein